MHFLFGYSIRKLNMQNDVVLGIICMTTKTKEARIFYEHYCFDYYLDIVFKIGT